MTTTTTTAAAAGVAAVSVAYDIAVTGPLAPGVLAHRAQVELIPTGKFDGKRELKQARYHTACTSQPAHCLSWGWARQHGAALCPTCFAPADAR